MPARKAAAVCYRLNEAGEPEFLLVRNKDDTHWVFPKGTVEGWEAFGYQAASREAFEEAGARGEVEARRLGTFRHQAWLKKSCEWTVQEVEAYLMRVTDTNGAPEPGREPTWFSLSGAREALEKEAAIPASEGGAATMLALAATRFLGAGTAAAVMAAPSAAGVEGELPTG